MKDINFELDKEGTNKQNQTSESINQYIDMLINYINKLID
jgi:hypothetical protein